MVVRTIKIFNNHFTWSEPGSSVGIATELRAARSGIESRWRRDSPHLSRLALGPPSLLYNGYRVFLGVKSGRGVLLTTHPLLVPWSRKSRAIPLLPLWAVRPVQSLSACTRMHFTVTLLYMLATCILGVILNESAEHFGERKICGINFVKTDKYTFSG